MRHTIFLTGLCMLWITGLCRVQAQEEVTLTVPILFERAIPADMDEVGEAVGKLVEEKIGVKVNLIAILYNTSSSTADQRQRSELDLLEKKGIIFDVFPSALYGKGFLSLDDLLKEDGKEILELIGEERMELCKEGGVTWTVPSVSDYASSFGITMRKDLVDEWQIDLEAIETIEDLDEVFERIAGEDPEMALVCSFRTRRGFVDRMKATKILVDPICEKEEDSDRFVNYYATEEYREMVSMFYRWNQKGYMPDTMPLQNLTGSSLVESGTLFSYFSPCKPSIEYEESISCGRKMVTIPLMEPMVTAYSLKSTVHWGINEKCEDPKAAMQFLNLLYTDAELVNLMIYGIEGVHYEIQEDGTIDYPEGVTEENIGYQNTQPWFLPNQLISYVWKGNDPLVWEKTKKFNEEAKWQEGLDFQFDTQNVAKEMEQLEKILKKYTYALESGQVDPEIYLPMMLEEMEKAGAERVIEEVQRQWDTDF